MSNEVLVEVTGRLPGPRRGNRFRERGFQAERCSREHRAESQEPDPLAWLTALVSQLSKTAARLRRLGAVVWRSRPG